jgi:hypothetical protein
MKLPPAILPLILLAACLCRATAQPLATLRPAKVVPPTCPDDIALKKFFIMDAFVMDKGEVVAIVKHKGKKPRPDGQKILLLQKKGGRYKILSEGKGIARDFALAPSVFQFPDGTSLLCFEQSSYLSQGVHVFLYQAGALKELGFMPLAAGSRHAYSIVPEMDIIKYGENIEINFKNPIFWMPGTEEEARMEGALVQFKYNGKEFYHKFLE